MKMGATARTKMTARKAAGRSVATSIIPSTERGEGSASPSSDGVAVRAYELYVLRGRVDGYDLNDWLAAEAEVLAEQPESDR
jgi:hypothetical protein